MKILPYRAVERAAWDTVAERSGEAWLHHRSDWIEVEAAYAARANCSFAVADDRGALAGVQPLYRRDLDRGWSERVLDSGYHRHAGLALRDDLTGPERQAARQAAMRHIFAEAEHHDVDRILLNVQNLAPRTLSGQAPALPFWVEEFGFEMGMHMTAVGDYPVPGMSNVFADQVVNLGPAEDELFRALDSACQRAIRKAEKADLTLEEAGADAIAAYYELAQLSAQRTGEVLLPVTYYQDIWNRLRPSGRAALLFVRQRGQAVAALFLLLDKGSAHFLAGVSHPDYLALRVNDYMHWKGMCWAKAHGQLHYRLGPIFPELPGDWPTVQVSRFKGKFGGQSRLVAQGNWFRKPERYADDCVRAARQTCAARLEQAQRQSATNCVPDPARDLVMLLRRYGLLAIDPRCRAKDLVERHGLWWPGCPTPFKDAAERTTALFLAGADADSLAFLKSVGIECRSSTGPALLFEPRQGWLAKRTPAYHALFEQQTFAGPDIEPIWQEAKGAAVVAWWRRGGRKILLVGTNFAEEIVRYTQGDPEQARRVHGTGRAPLGCERGNYLFDTNLVSDAADIPWADRLGFQVTRLLAEATGQPLARPWPGEATGLILVTADVTDAAVSEIAEQTALLGDVPITYLLRAGEAPPTTGEVGLLVDALAQPDRYESLCADQANELRAATGQNVRVVRNAGYLTRGYLGHLRTWEECGLTLDLNCSGLGAPALTGTYLPCRVRRPDGSWSSHYTLPTTFDDELLACGKLSAREAVQHLDGIASRLAPGILCCHLRSERLPETRLIHRKIAELAKRPGWAAIGVSTLLEWLEGQQTLDRKVPVKGAA